MCRAVKSTFSQVVDEQGEVVICDDCSTDDTMKVVSQLSVPANFKLRIASAGHNIGAIKNFLFALKQAQGDYVAFLDSDDYWCDNGKLQRQVDVLRSNPQCSLVHTAIKILYPDGTIVNTNSKHPTKSERIFYQTNVTTSSMMFRNSVELLAEYEKLMQKHKWCIDDMPFQLLLGLRGSFMFINEPMTVYCAMPVSASHFNDGRKSYLYDKSSMEIRNYFYPFYKDRLDDSDYHENLFHLYKQMLRQYKLMAWREIFPLLRLMPYYKMIIQRHNLRKK